MVLFCTGKGQFLTLISQFRMRVANSNFKQFRQCLYNANSNFNRKQEFVLITKQLMAANRQFLTFLFWEILQFPIFAPTNYHLYLVYNYY